MNTTHDEQFFNWQPDRVYLFANGSYAGRWIEYLAIGSKGQETLDLNDLVTMEVSENHLPHFMNHMVARGYSPHAIGLPIFKDVPSCIYAKGRNE